MIKGERMLEPIEAAWADALTVNLNEQYPCIQDAFDK
jgi:hypothetical protein